jgi:Endosomal/lysosomal potassium channel TMEM175
MLAKRRHDISRIEAFSDAAFAFALTLLVVSLEVPKSYDDLMRLMRGFPSFACCFALLVWIWHEHNMFFRRYGLQDAMTVFLNSVLLFVALFYVYPLKFMFDSMFAQFASDPSVKRMTLPELANASAIYGVGFFVLLTMFVLLYGHAYRKREELGLTPLEVFEVKAFAGHHMVSATAGLVALLVAVALPVRFAPFSPMCFGLMGPGHWWFGAMVQKRRQALERRLAVPARA